MNEILEISELFIPNLVTAAGVAISCGILGLFVLLRRQTLAALALPQAVTVGVALALRLTWPPLLTALAAVALCILLLSIMRSTAAADSMLAAIYLGALSIALLIVANAQVHLSEVQNRFTGGSDVANPPEANYYAAALLAIGLVTAGLWRRWLLLAQNPAVAELAGLHPARWNYLFYALLSAAILLGTSSLGVVLILAMLFLPAGAVLPWCRRIPLALAAAALLSLLLVAGGWIICIKMSWPFSQSVGALGFVILILSRLTAVFIRA